MFSNAYGSSLYSIQVSLFDKKNMTHQIPDIYEYFIEYLDFDFDQISFELSSLNAYSNIYKIKCVYRLNAIVSWTQTN